MAPSLLVALGCCATFALGQDWTFPDEAGYIRAGHWKAAVFDQYVYIDGGEMTQVGDDGDQKSYQITATLSIDCSSSWSPEDVEVNSISRSGGTVPVMSKQSLLTDPSNNFFYVHGGYIPYTGEAPKNDLWAFKVDEEGGGSWERILVDNPDVFENVPLTEGSAFASAKDGAIIISGAVGRTNFNGYKIYNYTTNEWEQEEFSEGWGATYSSDGSLYGGSAVFVEKFGAAGIIVVLGGGVRRFEDHSGYATPRTVSFYDVAEKKWYSQRTRGSTAPPGWEQGCAIGVEDTGDNDSFEIFVYGGANVDLSGSIEIGTIWALSLPGFVWKKVSDEDGHHRSSHTCVSLNSQLLTFGGLDLKGNNTWADPDPYPRGIGIFNLNSFSWEDSYDADAGNYTTHEDIRAEYPDGWLDEMDWSDEVRALFVRESGGSDGTSNGDSGDDNQDQNNDSNPDNGNDNGDDSSSTPVGAIAGGVVGGVAGLALIGAAIWYFLRKRGSGGNNLAELEQNSAQNSAEPVVQQPPPSAGPYQETKWSPAPAYGAELSTDPYMAPSELSGDAQRPGARGPVPELNG